MSFTAVVEPRAVSYQLPNIDIDLDFSAFVKLGMEPGAWDPVPSPGRPPRQAQNTTPPAGTLSIGTPPQAPRSSPLPQGSWADVPTEFHPAELRSVRTPDRNRPLPDPPSRPAVPAKDIGAWSEAKFGQQTSPRRRHRRPESLANLPPAAQSLRPDPGLLYPELSPYEPPHTARSAPERLPRMIVERPISQPAFSDDFDYLEPGRENYGPGMLPRSPTFPPGGAATMRSISSGNDHALQDEEEFHLFTAAMTGLGPIPTFRQSSIVEAPRAALAPSPELPRMSHRAQPGHEHPSVPFGMSPVEETPTTIRAYSNLPTMPSSSQSLAAPQPLRIARQTQQRGPVMEQEPIVDISDSGLHEPWEPAPPPEQESWQDIIDDQRPPDDELPDYASSQAQAHAQQRVEATRRAQELQRQWKATGRRYGSHG